MTSHFRHLQKPEHQQQQQPQQQPQNHHPTTSTQEQQEHHPVVYHRKQQEQQQQQHQQQQQQQQPQRQNHHSQQQLQPFVLVPWVTVRRALLLILSFFVVLINIRFTEYYIHTTYLPRQQDQERHQQVQQQQQQQKQGERQVRVTVAFLEDGNTRLRKQSNSSSNSKENQQKQGERESSSSSLFNAEGQDKPYKPKYGDLLYVPVARIGRGEFRRRIREKYPISARYEQWKEKELESMDKKSLGESYYSEHWDDQNFSNQDTCIRLKWTWDYFLSCNDFHQMSLERPPLTAATASATAASFGGEWKIQWLGAGDVMDAWMLQTVNSKVVTGNNGDDDNYKNNSNHPDDNSELQEEKDEEFVLRTVHVESHITIRRLAKIQNEAMSLLSTSSSRYTTNIYGHCGTSIAIERGYPIAELIVPVEDVVDPKRVAAAQQQESQQQQQQQQQQDVNVTSSSPTSSSSALSPSSHHHHNHHNDGTLRSMNELPPVAKLKVAIDMAQGLVALHGHHRGVLLQNDLDPDQWIFDKQGAIKLNDLNEGAALRWNPLRQQYCPHTSYFGLLYHPPESFTEEETDESVDTYGFCLMIYTILTGLIPHYDKQTYADALDALEKGEHPYIDPRWRRHGNNISRSRSSTFVNGSYSSAAYIDQRLVELMEQCWEPVVHKRMSMFDVLAHLQETVRIYERIYTMNNGTNDNNNNNATSTIPFQIENLDLTIYRKRAFGPDLMNGDFRTPLFEISL